MGRSEKLGLNYQYYPNLDQIIFEDGVCYTMREAIIVSRISKPMDLQAIHNVKKVFGGEIVHESEAKIKEAEDKSWFEVEPPVIGEDPSIPVKKKKAVIDAEILTLDL